jgi:hypothetical protein
MLEQFDRDLERVRHVIHVRIDNQARLAQHELHRLAVKHTLEVELWFRRHSNLLRRRELVRQGIDIQRHDVDARAEAVFRDLVKLAERRSA